MEHPTADPASSSSAPPPPPPAHYYTPYPQSPQPQSLPPPPPPHYYNAYQFHYASNPNPSPNPTYNTPPPYAPSYPPPAVAPYTPDPYAPHGGYGGLYASYQAPSPAAPAAPYHPEWRADYADQQQQQKQLGMNPVVGGGGPFAAGRSSNGQTPVFPVGIKPTIATTFVGAVPKKPAISSFNCEVCKIECTRQDILNMHKEGKKHKRNLKRLQELITEKPLNIVTNAGSNTAADDEQKKKFQQLIIEKPLNIVTNAGTKTAVDEQKKRKAVQVTVDMEVKRRKVLDSGVAAEEIRTCILCNVMCNSQSVFDSHIVGRKHASMVKNKQQQQQLT